MNQSVDNKADQKAKMIFVTKLVFSAALAVAIFIVDTFFVLDINIGISYVLVVLMGLLFKERDFTLYLGLGSLILLVVGFVFTTEEMTEASALWSLMQGLIAVSATTAGIYTQKRISSGPATSEADRINLLEIENENEQLLLALHNSALVSITDNSGKIVFANETFCAISKYTQEELIGENHRVLKSGMQPDGIFAGMWKAISLGKIWRGEICNKAKDGSYYWVYATIIPIMNIDGGIDKYVAIRFNITPLKAAEERLKVQQTELKRSNEELQQFAYVASHDLQEPLRMVSSYTQLLERKYSAQLDESAKEYIGFAVDGANRMQKLIKDLLEYSRISTKVQPNVKIDCNQLLKDVLSNLSYAISDANAKVDVSDLPKLIGDESQLTRLFQNLIGNAIKFVSNKDPEIRVTYTENEDNWQFSIKDNGIGIDDKYAERIFVIFQRLHGKEEFEGSGMGLAICRRIVERHDGKIWFESTANKGTEFFFTISKNLISS